MVISKDRIRNSITRIFRNANTVTLTKENPIASDDGSIDGNNNEPITLLAHIFPFTTKSLKVFEKSQMVTGSQELFLEYNLDYEVEAGDTLVDWNNIEWEIQDLKLWSLQSDLGYYQGVIIRKDLTN